MNMLDVKTAMRLALGKCPKCGERTLAEFKWLRGCTDRRCGWAGPKSRSQNLDS